MPLLFATAAEHLDVFLVALGLGFCIGVYGHMARQRWLVLTGIIIVLGISFYFVAAGEVQTFPN